MAVLSVVKVLRRHASGDVIALTKTPQTLTLGMAVSDLRM